MPGVVAGFTTVARLKAALRIPVGTTVDDGFLRDLVDAANERMQNALLRNVLTADYTEKLNGTGTGTLMLPNFPATAVSSVQLVSPSPVVNVSPPSSTLVEGVDFALTAYALKLFRGVWPKGVQNVQVAYTAGYAAMPADLATAATKMAAIRYREYERLGQEQKVLAGETVSFDLSEMPPDVQAVVNNYTVGMSLTAELQGTL